MKAKLVSTGVACAASTLYIFIFTLGLGLFAGKAMGQVTLTNLYSFTAIDGSNSTAGLVQGHDGYFYGVTQKGGIGGYGSAFVISPAGSYTNLYPFSYLFGGNPHGGLIQGTNGFFYGLTFQGGPGAMGGDGSVFTMDTQGDLSPLFAFPGTASADNGGFPYDSLVQGSDGCFYGTTYDSRYSALPVTNFGTIFRVSPDGSSYTNLHVFKAADGGYSQAGLVQGSDGNFYGTASGGGVNGQGTIFQITTNGTYANLHQLGGNEGAQPESALVQGNDGNFYGTASAGGANSCGTIFRISPGGSFTNLHSLVSSEGSNPSAALVLGSDGNFYGTTSAGGANNLGSVFRISPAGTLTTLYSFGSKAGDGAHPTANLVQGMDGSFYGVTYDGGANHEGTVFKLTAPLSTPANRINNIYYKGTNMMMTIAAVAGEKYQLQYRDSLVGGTWSTVPGGWSTSIGGAMTVTNSGNGFPAMRIYRFAIMP